jgi:hypothetical protein
LREERLILLGWVTYQTAKEKRTRTKSQKFNSYAYQADNASIED